MTYRSVRWKEVTAIVVGCLFLLVVAPRAPASVSYVSQWGSAGVGDGQFDNPVGVATDPAGNVYVADSNNNRIQKFNSNGNFLTKWGSPGAGDGQFTRPDSVATDSVGNVFVVDSGNRRVQKFDSNGNFLTKWGSLGSGDGEFDDPLGISTDPAGNVYVADYTLVRIQKFNSNGNFLTKWGSLGSGDGQFLFPEGIATDSASITYLVDGDNNRVQKFDSTGNFLTKWGSTGSDDGQFIDPSGVAVDPAGDVFVTDYGEDRVQKFDSTGNFLTKWGSTGSGQGQFDLPQGIATNSTGNVFVVDAVGNRIQKFFDNGVDSPPPVLGKKVVVKPVKGKVRTKCRGEKKFTLLKGADQIPVGCLVDTRKGVVRLTSSKGKAGGTQSANFWKGLFRVRQKAGKRPYTVLELAGSLGCGKQNKGKARGLRIVPTWTAAVTAVDRASVSKKRKRGRKLWGKGKGRFKTKGRYGSATVRGTQWLTQDRCNRSTLFRVKSGVVKVRDFVKKKTVTVKKGERYVAKERRG